MLAFAILALLYGAEQIVEKTWVGAGKSDSKETPPAGADDPEDS